MLRLADLATERVRRVQHVVGHKHLTVHKLLEKPAHLQQRLGLLSVTHSPLRSPVALIYKPAGKVIAVHGPVAVVCA